MTRKTSFVFTVLACFAVLLTVSANADTVDLYVDSAPNAYGSPNFPAWEANAYSTASDGSFVNMGNSVNPANAGTTNFEIQDVVVYSFGDLGRRLHFVYWIPGETVADLAGRFEVSMSYQWDGVTYDGYNDWYGQTWIEPTRWIDYDNGSETGVIGSAGFAWWGAYGVNTPGALAIDLADWDRYQGDVTFTARLDGDESSLTAYHTPVPEPGTMMLLGSGLVGLAGYAKRRKKS